jgi:hypothetical protein
LAKFLNSAGIKMRVSSHLYERKNKKHFFSFPFSLSVSKIYSKKNEAIMSIFKATYSGVPVYEMLCKGVAVMRRRSDSYLNATQILKVADFDKPQRTRILEREVQIGQHEKVQGGYGKYQGKKEIYHYYLYRQISNEPKAYSFRHNNRYLGSV